MIKINILNKKISLIINFKGLSIKPRKENFNCKTYQNKDFVKSVQLCKNIE